MSFEMENAKATADFVDLTVRIADKYGEDRERALKLNIVGLISAQQFFNFDKYKPKNEPKNDPEVYVSEEVLKSMSRELIDKAEKISKEYCKVYATGLMPGDVKEVTKQLLQYLAKKVNETTQERREDDKSN